MVKFFVDGTQTFLNFIATVALIKTCNLFKLTLSHLGDLIYSQPGEGGIHPHTCNFVFLDPN